MPLPLSVNVTPPGRAPLSLTVGVGEPVVVTVNVPDAPVVNVVAAALVMAGAVGCGGVIGVFMSVWICAAVKAPL